ncbi:hypothetical protein D3C84_521990 [compost metagenome]
MQLPGHQIEAGDQFSHRVFHLQPGVHFQKVELPVRVQQKLHSASAHIVHRATGLERRFAHGLAQFGGHDRAGCFFDDFLMAALDRTVAFAEVDQVAVLVAEQLNLNVTRIDQRLFEDQFVAAKPVQCLGARGANLCEQIPCIVHQAHAASAAAGTGLDHQRIADAFGFAAQGRVVLPGALIAFDAGHTGVEHGEFRQAFAAHQFDGFRAGADESEAGVLAGAGEFGIFREEAVAGVD